MATRQIIRIISVEYALYAVCLSTAFQDRIEIGGTMSIMRNLNRCTGISLCLYFIGLAGGVAAEEEIRTWTSVNGAQVEAQFVKLTDRQLVILDAVGGKQLFIPLNQLSPEDQTHVLVIVREVEDDEDDEFEPLKDAWLPVFDQGPYEGAFAVVEDALYTLTIDGVGDLEIVMKDERGNAVGTPVRMRGFRTHYYGPDTRRGKEGRSRAYHRPVETLAGPPLRPVLNPSSIRISGTLRDGVSFRQSFTFGRGKVDMAFDYEDPDGIKYRTYGGGVRFPFPRSHEIAPEVEQEERIALLNDHVLTMFVKKGSKPLVYRYWEPIQRIPNRIVKAVIRGLWGPRELTLEFQGTPAKGGGVYRGNSLWQGYGFSVSWEPPEVKKSGVTISIN